MKTRALIVAAAFVALTGGARAGFVDCGEYEIVAPVHRIAPVVHFAPKRHHSHRGSPGSAARIWRAHRMCPVVGESLGGYGGFGDEGISDGGYGFFDGDGDSGQSAEGLGGGLFGSGGGSDYADYLPDRPPGGEGSHGGSTPIPEPATWLMMLLGLAGVSILRHRKAAR